MATLTATTTADQRWWQRSLTKAMAIFLTGILTAAGAWFAAFLGGVASMPFHHRHDDAPAIQIDHPAGSLPQCTMISGISRRSTDWDLWVTVKASYRGSPYFAPVKARWTSDDRWEANVVIGAAADVGKTFQVVAFEVPASWGSFMDGLQGFSNDGPQGYPAIASLPPNSPIQQSIDVTRKANPAGFTSCH